MTHSSRIAAAILGFCLGTPGLAAALETLNYSGKLEEATRSPSGVFDPVVEWIWTRSASSPWPNHLNVMTTPGVIDLNGDDVPDLVFGATDSNAGSSLLVGVLCALDGADGSELFTVGSPMISTTMSVAVGDIDLDGLPEIVTCDASGTRMMAFEHDGIVQWISPNAIANTKWGAPSIADLDGDGVPEIVIGRSVFDNLGNLQWTGVGGSGEQGAGPLSLIADLDLDGTSEVVAGNTAYLSDGSFLWVNSSVSDGYNAVGNFDDDDFAEVVLVSSGTVILLEGETGSIKWGPMAIPGGGVGGPPGWRRRRSADSRGLRWRRCGGDRCFGSHGVWGLRDRRDLEVVEGHSGCRLESHRFLGF
jgi:hypothetical protein